MSIEQTSIANPHLLAIDVGGTHTDIVLVDMVTGKTHRHKIPSTPREPARAVKEGTRQVLDLANVLPKNVAYFAHGMTVATNALVQGQLANAALITTKGFRDILEIRRQRQPHIYNTRISKPKPPIPRGWRLEIDERHFLLGSDHRPPKKDEISAVADFLIEQNINAVAICFMHSYCDSSHERQVHALLTELMPRAFVCLSSDVLAEFREYERTSTTSINAALGPIMESYLSSIENDAVANGLTVEPRIMQSNGGVTSPREAATLPIGTLASGPAAGVIGATEVARELGYSNIITFDVGGTTADVCLVEEYEPLLAVEREFGGYPVRYPTIDALSVGAGGGSIAWVDSGGFLHVGPKSAGADPGPVCYGKGGTEPTVTDANLVLGRLNSNGLLAGRLKVDTKAARQEIERTIAKPNNMTVEEAAIGILTILNENMVQAVRVISVERGFDPREFTLVAFGGGGPLLAGKLARELGMSQIIIPLSPGLLCAEGLLVAETRADFSLTRIMELTPENNLEISKVLSELVLRARGWFEDEGINVEKRQTSFAIDMRYKGQSHELRVNLDEASPERVKVYKLSEAFVEEHKKSYGFAPDLPVELVTFRIVARTPNHERPVDMPLETVDDSLIGTRQVYFESSKGYVECPVYSRQLIKPGVSIPGPAIIEQMDTTTVVDPGDKIVSMPSGDLIQYIC